MTEKDQLTRTIAESGVDLTEDGVGDTGENAARIAEAVLAAGWTMGPGAPKTDETARNAAMHAIANLAQPYGITFERAQHIADAVADMHTVTWERDVNEHGVPVRRYVLRGEWDVDPEARELHWRQTLDRGTGA